MKYFFFILKTLSFFYLSLSIKANTDFIIDKLPLKLNPEESTILENFLQKTSSALGDTFLSHLDLPIHLEFIEFDQHSDLDELPQDKCSTKVSILYGRTNVFESNKIQLNVLLLKEILKGEENAISFPCGHKNYYQQAMATIIHESAHLYDNLFHLTKHQSYLKLSGFEHSLFLKKRSKNIGYKRTLDRYEFFNLEENFATNFEYFILDQDYKCKRPSYYEYFEYFLQIHPHQKNLCKINTQIILDDNKAPINLDPARILRIDYLLANKGEGLSSGFGHSMFRIILCAPFRKKVDDECLKDKLFHVVISFRANVTDLKTNPIKGILGQYDSILYLLSFPKVLEEYNVSELRDLYSVPLKLSSAEIKNFIYKTLENYWEFSGKYKFITENCATESLDLFQSALNQHAINNEFVLKPYSLLEIFSRYQLTEEKTIFESSAKKLARLKTELFGISPDDVIVQIRPSSSRSYPNTPEKTTSPKDIKDILKTLSTMQIQNLLQSLVSAKEGSQRTIMLNQFSILLDALIKIYSHDIDETIAAYLEAAENEQSDFGEDVREWRRLRKEFRISPLENDYGIPINISAHTLESYNTHGKELDGIEKKIILQVKEKFPTEVNHLIELQKMLENARRESKI